MFDVAHVVDDLERRHGRRHGQGCWHWTGWKELVSCDFHTIIFLLLLLGLLLLLLLLLQSMLIFSSWFYMLYNFVFMWIVKSLNEWILLLPMKSHYKWIIQPAAVSAAVMFICLFTCILMVIRYDTIRYDSVYLTCSKKLTGSQLSLPHGIRAH